MTPKEHAKLLGLFMWIFAGLHLIIVAAIAVVYMAFAGVIAVAIANEPHRPGSTPPPPPEVIIGFMFVAVIIIVAATLFFMLPKIISGYGLRKGRSWAKAWTIVACVLAVLNFPLGTAVGVYGFWFVFGDAGKAYFDGPDFAAREFQPPPNSWQ
jgi:hypothetical protein